MRTTITVPNPTPVVEFDPFKPMVLPWTNNRKSSRGRKKVTVPHETIVQAKNAVSLVVQQIVAPAVIDPPIKKIEPPSVLMPLHQLKRLIGFDVVAEIKKMYERDFIKSHLQNVATPWNLVQEIFQKLKIGDGAILCMFNVEWVAYLVRVLKKDVNTIFFVDDGLDMNDGTGKITSIKAQLVVDMLGVPKENIIHHSKIEGNTMKFDYIVGNPPYQEKKEGNKKSNNLLWQQIILNIGKNVKSGCTVSLIHPSGWRSSEGDFFKTRELYNSWNLLYLNINDISEGQKVFGASTRFDWYIARVEPYQGQTVVNDENGFETVVDLRDYSIIPNSFEVDVNKWIGGGEKCDYGYSAGSYHTQRKYMSKTKSDTHKFPCVMNVGVNNQPTKFWYSNVDKGMFGVPKVIFGTFGNGVFIDSKGEYACTQHCAYIAAPVEELERIRKVLQSEEFQKAAIATYVGGTGTIFDRKFMKQLRKDFWK